MINELHARLNRPEKGWDPVPDSHVEEYSGGQWKLYNDGTVDLILNRIEVELGSWKDKRILDLGGGPGQFSIAMAERGGKVTWHDVSKRYRDVAIGKAREHGVEIEFSLGYLEEAEKFVDTPFDFVFNRICWFYCMNDNKFARMIHDVLVPGGLFFLQHEAIHRNSGGNWREKLYDRFGVKIGHPYPNAGVIEGCLSQFRHQSLSAHYYEDGRPMYDLFIRK